MLVRAGVPEAVCMAVSGHKTRSTFDRYNIINETDVANAFVAVQRHQQAERKRIARR